MTELAVAGGMRRRTYVAMMGAAALAGCSAGPGETDEDGTTEQSTEETDSGSFQQLWEADLPDETVMGSDYQATGRRRVSVRNPN